MKTYPWSSKRPLGSPGRGRTRGVLAALILLALTAAGAFGATTARAATYNAWTAQSPGVNTTWYGDWFSDASNGWLVGGTGNIRHTTNGGATWAAQTSGTTQNLRGVCGAGWTERRQPRLGTCPMQSAGSPVDEAGRNPTTGSQYMSCLDECERVRSRRSVCDGMPPARGPSDEPLIAGTKWGSHGR